MRRLPVPFRLSPRTACLASALFFLAPSIGPRDVRAQTPRPAARTQRVPLTVERHVANAPVTFGVPMPVKALDSSDLVRVLTPDLREVPSQINEVSTWQPQDPSVKWIWVFFFTTASTHYLLEFGPEVHRAAISGPRLAVYNNQRPGGGVDIETGPLKFSVRKGDG